MKPTVWHQAYDLDQSTFTLFSWLGEVRGLSILTGQPRQTLPLEGIWEGVSLEPLSMPHAGRRIFDELIGSHRVDSDPLLSFKTSHLNPLGTPVVTKVGT